MPPDYSMTFKAIITMERVAKELVPDLDLLSAVKPYVTGLVAERYSPRRLVQNAYEAVRELSDSAGTLPATARGILEDLHAGRTRLNIEVARWDELQPTYAAVQRRKYDRAAVRRRRALRHLGARPRRARAARCAAAVGSTSLRPCSAVGSSPRHGGSEHEAS